MMLVDANLLIHAVDADSPHHAQVRCGRARASAASVSVLLPCAFPFPVGNPFENFVAGQPVQP